MGHSLYFFGNNKDLMDKVTSTNKTSNFKTEIIKTGTFNCKLTVTSRMEPLNEHFLKVHEIFSKF